MFSKSNVLSETNSSNDYITNYLLFKSDFRMYNLSFKKVTFLQFYNKLWYCNSFFRVRDSRGNPTVRREECEELERIARPLW